jgi:hypothetical protein
MEPEYSLAFPQGTAKSEVLYNISLRAGFYIETLCSLFPASSRKGGGENPEATRNFPP